MSDKLYWLGKRLRTHQELLTKLVEQIDTYNEETPKECTNKTCKVKLDKLEEQIHNVEYCIDEICLDIQLLTQKIKFKLENEINKINL